MDGKNATRGATLIEQGFTTAAQGKHGSAATKRHPGLLLETPSAFGAFGQECIRLMG